jgi:tetratricopeptide (TPR) repeat protein
MATKRRSESFQTGSATKRRRERIPRGLACLLAASVVALAAGCAVPERQATTHGAASRPVVSEKAMLSLDQVLPAEPLASPHPSTAPTTAPASLQALQLYAQARVALESGQRFTAVQLLAQALAMDPDSLELNMAMGEAASGTALASRAMPCLQRAADLDPDNIDVYIQMARLHLAAGEGMQAARALRKAQQTSAYRDGGPQALAVDFFLARTLQVMGYDSAALRQYDLVLGQMPRINPGYRGPVEVMQILRNPDLVFVEVSRLSASLGDYKTALAAIEQAMIESPDTSQYALMRVRLLQQAGRPAEARAFVPEVVSRFGAGVETLALVREIYGASGGEVAAIADLRKALRAHKDDQNLAYALADMLVRTGGAAEARTVLTETVKQLDYRTAPVKRLFDLLESQGQTLDAARLLIEASARRPEQLSELDGPMSRLTRISRSNHLRLHDLQSMSVESWAESARLYWVAKVAKTWDRDELARAALEKAVRTGKPFAPAFRELLDHYFRRRDWDQKRMLQTAQDLITLSSLNGDKGLTAELRGLIALQSKDLPSASEQFLEAMRVGNAMPEVQLEYGLTQLARKNVVEGERILLKLCDDHPLFDQGYTTLYLFYRDRQMPSSMLKTLQRWLSADPQNPTARILQAAVYRVSGREDTAERILLDLFEQYADSAEVLDELGSLYAESGRLEQYIRLLEQKRQSRPDIREVAEQLVKIYNSQGRIPEADRVIADLRRSAAGDSDLLYETSNLYVRINDEKSAESVLEEALKVDPQHSSAANNLGYYLAQQGRDLDRAEALVRIAVTAEPDNQAFLDSLGWVMYKRGRLEPAREFLEKAVAQTINPDPVVLDHLGDAYYRLGRKDDAIKRWETAREGLESLGRGQTLPREYLTTQQNVIMKLAAVRDGRQANTAAIVGPETPASKPASGESK